MALVKMNDPKLDAEALVSQAESFRTFLGLIRPLPTDRFFLVTGMTGSGKSTFVSRCTGQNAVVSHRLYSCTNSLDVFQYTRNGQRIYLIDTPGFNDTTRTDIDTLSILAAYLGASYANGARIHGIILLYPLSNNRMSGSSLRSLRLLKTMCGFTSYCNLAIVTTMWPESPNLREREVFENRETELRTNKAFFGDLIAQGARLFQHHEEGYGDTLSQVISARRIVEHLVHQSESYTPDALQLQRELVDEKKTLEQTAAGFVAAEHLHAARQEHEGELKKLRTDMTEALRSSDKEYALQLKDIKTEMETKLQKAETDRQALTKTMTAFHQTETVALQRRIVDLNKRFAAEVKTKEQELQRMQTSLNRIRLEVDRLSQEPQQKQLIARRTIEQQQAVESARRKAEKAREEQLQFDMYAQAIVNGLVNGLASGMTSGGVAALTGAGMCIMM